MVHDAVHASSIHVTRFCNLHKIISQLKGKDSFALCLLPFCQIENDNYKIKANEISLSDLYSMAFFCENVFVSSDPMLKFSVWCGVL